MVWWSGVLAWCRMAVANCRISKGMGLMWFGGGSSFWLHAHCLCNQKWRLMHLGTNHGSLQPMLVKTCPTMCRAASTVHIFVVLCLGAIAPVQ